MSWEAVSWESSYAVMGKIEGASVCMGRVLLSWGKCLNGRMSWDWITQTRVSWDESLCDDD